MSVLEQHSTKKGQVDETTSQIKLDKGDSKEYKVKAVCNSAVYASKSEGYLPGFYYFVSWKSYPKEENT